MPWISLSYDITEDITVYKNLEEKRPKISQSRTFTESGMQESVLCLPLHTGTHVDYPLHMIENGKCSSDFSLFPHQGLIFLLDLSKAPITSVTASHFEDISLYGIDGLFIKTSDHPQNVFDPQFPWLDEDGANHLSRFPLKYVGIDQPGIERNQPGHQTHKQLLGHDILIIEGLDLSHLSQGLHRVLLTTLRIPFSDAEPLMAYAKPLNDPE